MRRGGILTPEIVQESLYPAKDSCRDSKRTIVFEATGQAGIKFWHSSSFHNP